MIRPQTKGRCRGLAGLGETPGADLASEPRQEPALPTPLLSGLRLQSRERTRFCGFKQPGLWSFVSAARGDQADADEVPPEPGLEPTPPKPLPSTCRWSSATLLKGAGQTQPRLPGEKMLKRADLVPSVNGARLPRPSIDQVTGLALVMDLCHWSLNTRLQALQPDFQNSALAQRKTSLCFSFVRKISLVTSY